MYKSRTGGWIALVIAAVVVSVSIAWAIDAKTGGSAAERGKYLVNALGGCNDCHTPLMMTDHGPVPDMSKLLSGHPAGMSMPAAPQLQMPWAWAGSATDTAFYGPWGTSYAVNLTPDMETGIGAWSEAAFVGAMKTGKHMGVGRPILPPMPISTFQKMSDSDIKAIYAYLKTIPAISNKVPDPTPPAGK